MRPYESAERLSLRPWQTFCVHRASLDFVSADGHRTCLAWTLALVVALFLVLAPTVDQMDSGCECQSLVRTQEQQFSQILFLSSLAKALTTASIVWHRCVLVMTLQFFLIVFLLVRSTHC